MASGGQRNDPFQTGCDGRVGFVNLGNTCYMSAAVQSVTHTDPLRQYFITQPIEQMVNWQGNENQSIEGYGAYYYAILVRQLWSNKFSSLRFFSLKEVICRQNEEFIGYNQCDSEELLGTLLDRLSKDLHRQQFQITPGVVGNDSHAKAATEWAKFRCENSTIVSDLFYFQNATTIICGRRGCERSRYIFSQCNVMYLTFPGEKDQRKWLDSSWNFKGRKKLRMSMANILQFNYDVPVDTDVELTCPVCDRKSVSKQHEKLWSLPRYLIVNLKRFDPILQNKIEITVDCPLTGLDLKPYIHQENPQKVSTKYDLYAVVNHLGATKNSGHYISIAKPSGAGAGLGWRKFNDNRVTDINLSVKSEREELINENNYILFFKRQDV